MAWPFRRPPKKEEVHLVRFLVMWRDDGTESIPGCPLLLSATRRIEEGTLIEIAPVLLFEKREYEEHGRFTLLDHYTFTWSGGRMALPLGHGRLTSGANKTCIRAIGTVIFPFSWLLRSHEFIIKCANALWQDRSLITHPRQTSRTPRGRTINASSTRQSNRSKLTRNCLSFMDISSGSSRRVVWNPQTG